MIATRQADVREGRHVPAARYTQWTTPEGQSNIRQWVADGLSDREIADKIGIDKSLLSSWRRKYPAIREALYRRAVTADGAVVDKHDTYPAKARALDNVARVKGLVEDYIETCKAEDRPITKPGLALALGIDSETLQRYVNDGSIKNATPAADKITG